MKYFILLFVCCLNTLIYSQNIVINEVSSINSTAWTDENYDTPDWIELKNISSAAINLEGYKISDKDDFEKAWALPDTLLEPNEVLLLSASDKAFNSSEKYVIEADGSGIVPGHDQDGFAYLYLEYDGDFVAEFDFSSMRNTGTFGAAGIMFKEDLTDEAKYFGVFNLQRDRFTYGLMRRTELGKGTEIDYSYHHNIHPWGLIRLERKGDTIIAFDIENGYRWREFARFESDFKKKGYLGLGFSSAKMNQPGKFTFSDFSINGENIAISSLQQKNIDLIEDIKFYKSNEIHTDFKLSRSGETLTLWNKNGEIEHSIIVPAQNVDISLARRDNGEMLISSPPTPGAENDNFFNGRCEIPALTTKSGYFENIINIEFDEKPGETIYYTLNGESPEEKAFKYTQPFGISQTLVLRAQAHAPGMLPSKVLTRTFVAEEKYSLPIVSMVTDYSNLWDKDKGLFIEKNLYWPNDKPGHFEIIDTNGNLEMYSDGTMRLHGQRSRTFEQKSIRFHANAISDSTEYTHPFFGKESFASYEKILFRNGGTGWNSALLTDAFTSRIIRNIPNVTVGNYRAALSYLNGNFYGITNMREKVDEDLLAEKYDIPEESINFVEDNLSAGSGSAADFYEDMTAIMSMDMTSSPSYQFVDENFDLDNLYSYLATQIFICNIDWPWKNVKYWSSNELDSKWRFIPHDMDYSFGCSAAFWEYDIFTLLKDDQRYPNFFRKIWENQQIKEATINRICDLMNSVFLPENTKPVLEKMIKEIEPYIPLQQSTYEESAELWAHSMDKMRAFAGRRAFRLREHMIAYFECGDSAFVNVDINNNSAGYVRLNSLTLNTFPWSGQYFTDVPIDVEAVANPGHKFIKWSNPEYGTNPKLSVTPKDAMSLVAIFDDSDEGLPIVINEIMYKASDSHDTGDWIEIYNPNHEPADLSLWTITDSKPDNVFTFPEGTNLAPESYLVIARKGDDFQQYHSDIEYLDDLGFGLSDDDAIKVYDSEGLLIDSVDYKSVAPWPTTAAGTGSSIELIKAKLDNSLGQNWSASLVNNGTPGEKNSVDTGLLISLSTEVAVYPNPVSQYLFVKTNKAELEYRLIDINGNTVLSGNLYYSAALNCSNFAAGTYMLELIDSGKREVIPIVIIR